MRPLRWIYPLFLTATLVSPLSAASSACSVTTNAGTISGDSLCSLNALPGYLGSANAFASGSVNIALNQVSVNTSARAVTNPTNNLSKPGQFVNQANASFTEAVTVFIPGSGEGFMEASLNGSTSRDSGDDGVLASFSLGPVSLQCANMAGCPLLQNPSLIPIELGSTYVFDVNVVAWSDSANGVAQAAANVDASFSFFGSDRVTPLDVTLAPEPSQWLMLCIGLAGASALVIRIRLKA